MASDGVVAPELARVKPAEVAERVKANEIVIVDVRDEKEVAEGRIKGSLNVPSSVFKSDDPAALDQVIKGPLSGAKEVVVHCHFCKVRGPTCAQALNNRLKALGAEAGTEVKVLDGGIAAFMEQFKGDGALVELPEAGWNPAAQH
ncbi:hypothetical protein PLESTB_001605100 [Pleodorina starrii]|uniref:Rhodanese domain-containing protein n=1 Tax=Pleodorina starrii TaxID=330485 RepID=A0A9W6BXH9_9CHLO|nr:hypothetical protein PLESTM_000175100 [Pleodorina starrii]GLC60371.1 hypothetical protein PLESTB_001605100 [Pleodorina starrii]GLC69384.1 hypothetical protein PLESTF_000824000 [Pleodorina starrii]